MLNAIIHLAQGLGYAFTATIFLFIAKGLWDMRTTRMDDDHELLNGNTAVAFRRSGLYLGYAVGMICMLAGPSKGFFTDLGSVALNSVILLAGLFIARAINDKVLLGKINNDDAVQQGNTAVGIAELGSYLATGAILGGAWTGSGSLWTAVVFFALGQLALIICYAIYAAQTPWDDSMEIANGNKAAAIELAGVLTALGVVLGFSVAGDFTSWTTDITAFVITAAVGIFAVMVWRKIVDAWFLAKTNLTEEIVKKQNVATTTKLAFLLVATAGFIGVNL